MLPIANARPLTMRPAELPAAVVVVGTGIDRNLDDEGRQSDQISEHKAVRTASNLSWTSNLSPRLSHPTLPPPSPVLQFSPASANDRSTMSIAVY
jgi:hypothetical protein